MLISQPEINFEATEAKKAGQRKALSSVDPEYRYQFDVTIDHLIKEGQPFTIDDVVEAIGLPSKGQNKNNAVGALVSGAAREGLIKKLGYTVSRRAQNHGRVICQWIGV